MIIIILDRPDIYLDCKINCLVQSLNVCCIFLEKNIQKSISLYYRIEIELEICSFCKMSVIQQVII